jgi:Protein of unknown function (DUF2778)
MSNVSVASDELFAAETPPAPRHFLVGAAPRILALGLSVWAGSWVLHKLPHNGVAPALARAPAPSAASIPVAASIPAPTLAAVPAPAAAVAPKAAVAALSRGAVFDPEFYAGSGLFMPASPFLAQANVRSGPARSVAALAKPESAARIPQARAHLADRAIGAIAAAAPARVAAIGKAVSPALGSPDAETMRKLFGGAETTGPALAYASAQSGMLDSSLNGPSGPSALYDRWTAVYDVSAHTVYLPNGARLEAHSGLGNRLDDPAHAYEHNRGATPPHVYELASVDEPFHGVHALRLNPVGGGNVYGRDGLLAHTYMLGPKGDSNGCVAFKNYTPFLEAFESGQVKRLAVVARLD